MYTIPRFIVDGKNTDVELGYFRSEPMTKKFFDLEKILADKNPTLAKWLPGFVLRYLKRILHEDEINGYIQEFEGLEGADFCRATIKAWDIETELVNPELAPTEGGAIFVCNHPLGGMDAVALISKFDDYRKDIKFIANDVLMNIPGLKGSFVGLDKYGSAGQRSVTSLNDHFASDNAIFIFPAGLVSRRKKGKVRDLEWKKTFVTRAKKYERPIVPVHIDGQLSNFFYRFSNIREKLGIKANIELIFLINEMFKQKGRKVTFTFGKPIQVDELNTLKEDYELAQDIKQVVYNLVDE